MTRRHRSPTALLAAALLAAASLASGPDRAAAQDSLDVPYVPTPMPVVNQMLELARRNAHEAGVENVEFLKGEMEAIPLPDASVDVIISNCVVNLSPDKAQVFEEAHRVLAPGGRLAISDIISEEVMPESIKNDEDLWAACIGGAEQIDRYTTAIEAAGFSVTDVRENTQYEFISERAANACQKYGVKSISLGATR